MDYGAVNFGYARGLMYNFFMEGKVKILKLKTHSPDQELEFELEFLNSLTLEARFEMLFERMEIFNRMLNERKFRKTPEVIKRK